jgi:hypothetical protein
MHLDRIIAVAAEHLIGRIVRRALVAVTAGALAVVAIFHFTVAAMIALEGVYGDLNMRLIIGGIYAALALVLVGIFLALRPKSGKTAAPPALGNPREMQLVMLLEAAMLGYSLARRREKAS